MELLLDTFPKNYDELFFKTLEENKKRIYTSFHVKSVHVQTLGHLIPDL